MKRCLLLNSFLPPQANGCRPAVENLTKYKEWARPNKSNRCSISRTLILLCRTGDNHFSCLVYTTGEDSVMTLECHRRTLSLELECVTSVALTMTSEVEEVIAPDNARLCHNQGDWYTSRQLG
ncbi:hypothetical protein J6590_083429 [Homalodisca vitripennis]|nr:hypothetical protein J6590_083429 [Homalodisca vitripennis]